MRRVSDGTFDSAYFSKIKLQYKTEEKSRISSLTFNVLIIWENHMTTQYKPPEPMLAPLLITKPAKQREFVVRKEALRRY